MARLYFVPVLLALTLQAQPDHLPAINRPVFVSPEQASSWLHPNEPVLVVEQGGEARAYPRQILVWHELVNDQIAGLPIVVSYCPLGDSAVVSDRCTRYDRRTGTRWQQVAGEGVAATLTGGKLRRIPSQTVSFETFSRAFPAGRVLSRETGYRPDYEQNPDARQEPLERLVAIHSAGKRRAYPFSLFQRRGVVEERLGKQRFVIFFDGAVGAAGVFSPELEGKRLSLRRKDGRIVDKETGSTWNLFGIATAGLLAGKRLAPVDHGVAFAFAWLGFHPETQVVGDSSRAADVRHKAPEGMYGRRDALALQPWP